MSRVVDVSGSPRPAPGRAWAAPGRAWAASTVALAPQPSAPSAAVRVLLVDDHPIVRSGVRYVLDHQDSVVVVQEATTGREAIRLALDLRPDVVVMDLG